MLILDPINCKSKSALCACRPCKIPTNHFGHKIGAKVGNTAFGSNDDHGIKIEF